MRLKDTLTHDGNDFTVETYDLTIPHGPERNQEYETLVNGRIESRHETKSEASDAHKRVVSRLNNGEYEFECIAEKVVISDD